MHFPFKYLINAPIRGTASHKGDSFWMLMEACISHQERTKPYPGYIRETPPLPVVPLNIVNEVKEEIKLWWWRITGETITQL